MTRLRTLALHPERDSDRQGAKIKYLDFIISHTAAQIMQNLFSRQVLVEQIHVYKGAYLEIITNYASLKIHIYELHH